IKFKDFDIPPLTLQPVVENAVKHGVMEKLQGGKVEITVKKDGNTALLKVSDNGVGFEENNIKSESVGLKNIVYRLKVAKGTLVIDSKIGKGTSITITLPLKGKS
ncbi:MAG: ATP-binding protein, partial [Anaerovoracaceae bacterium]